MLASIGTANWLKFLVAWVG